MSRQDIGLQISAYILGHQTKVECIKAIREIGGWSLQEAKLAVDEVERLIVHEMLTGNKPYMMSLLENHPEFKRHYRGI